MPILNGALLSFKDELVTVACIMESSMDRLPLCSAQGLVLQRLARELHEVLQQRLVGGFAEGNKGHGSLQYSRIIPIVVRRTHFLIPTKLQGEQQPVSCSTSLMKAGQLCFS